MSYVAHKSRLFRDNGDAPELVKKRSEGRLKNYISATDARVWTSDNEDRRQHLLDLIKSDHAQTVGLGKYVPIEVLVDTLLANKTADCEKLKRELEMYKKIPLTPDQKILLENMKGQAKSATTSKQARFDAASKQGKSNAATSKQTKLRSVSAESKSTTIDNEERSLFSDSSDVGSLKRALQEKEAECCQQRQIATKAIEKLERLKNILEERDDLKRKLESSQCELETLKKKYVAFAKEPCVEEIAALEEEIEQLKGQGRLSDEAETNIIRKEIEVLKRYCSKLSAIQEENYRLKQQLSKSNQACNTEPAEPETSDDIEYLRSKVDELKNERDQLKIKVEELEKEMLQYSSLPEELETFRRKSEILDDVMQERDSLKSRLDKLKGLECEVKKIKEKADRVEELEAQIAKRRQSGDDGDMEKLKRKAKEADTLRIERDNMKIRLDQLKNVEAEFTELLSKTWCMDTIKRERDMYKAKYEEIIDLECQCDMLQSQVQKYKKLEQERDCLLNRIRECETYIGDQEEEIKKLVAHIDERNQGSKQQYKLQQALGEMRSELEQKNQLIAFSDQELAGIQDELEQSISGVTGQANRVLELEQRLKENQEETVKTATKSVEKTDVGDEHFDTIIEQSKIAVEVLTQQLETERIVGESPEELNSRIRALELQLCEAGATIANLQNKLKEFQDVHSENKELKRISIEVQGTAKDEMLSITQQLKRCQQRVQELESLLSNTIETDVKTEVKTEVITDEKSIGYNVPTVEKSTNCAELKEENERLKTQIKTLESLLLEAGDSDLRQKLKDAEDLIAQLRKQIAETESRLKQEIEELKQSNVNLQSKVTSLQSELGASPDKGPQIVEKEQSSRLAPTGDDSNLQKMIEQLKAQLQAEKDKVGQLEGMVKNQQEKTQRLGAENLTLESISPQAVIKDRSAEIDDLKSQLAKCQEKIKRLETDNSVFKETTFKKDSMVDDLQQQLRKSQVVLQQLERENESLKVTDENVDVASLKSQLKKCREENDKFKKQIDALTSGDNADLIREIDRLNNIIGELESKIKAMEKEYGDNIGAVKSQYDRDLKTVHNKHNDSVSKLQNFHEENVKRLSREFEQEFASIRSELRSSKQLIDKFEKESIKKSIDLVSTTTENVNIKSSIDTKLPICSCGSNFKEILYRILSNGMEALSVEELQFLQAKTSNLLSRKPSAAGECICGKKPNYRGLESTKAGKEFLNGEGKAQQYMALLQKESEKIKELQNELESEKMRVEDLRNILSSERNRAKEVQKRDTYALETMRVKLEKYISSDITLRRQTNDNNKGAHPCSCSRSIKTSVYTELTVQNVTKQESFDHQCSMRRSRQSNTVKSSRRSSSAQPCSCRSSEVDD